MTHTMMKNFMERNNLRSSEIIRTESHRWGYVFAINTYNSRHAIMAIVDGKMIVVNYTKKVGIDWTIKHVEAYKGCEKILFRIYIDTCFGNEEIHEVWKTL